MLSEHPATSGGWFVHYRLSVVLPVPYVVPVAVLARRLVQFGLLQAPRRPGEVGKAWPQLPSQHLDVRLNASALRPDAGRIHCNLDQVDFILKLHVQTGKYWQRRRSTSANATSASTSTWWR